jgi:hypothetical protein
MFNATGVAQFVSECFTWNSRRPNDSNRAVAIFWKLPTESVFDHVRDCCNQLLARPNDCRVKYATRYRFQVVTGKPVVLSDQIVASANLTAERT